MIQLTEKELVTMLNTAAQMAAERTAARLAPGDDLITQNEAYRQFGRRTIENLRSQGLTPRRTGPAANSKLVYSLADIRSMTTAIQAADMIISRIAR